MPIDVVCSEGHKLRVPSRLKGKRVICPACGNAARVPGVSSFSLGYRIAITGIVLPVLAAFLIVALMFLTQDGRLVISLGVFFAIVGKGCLCVGTVMAAVEKGRGVPMGILLALFGILGFIIVVQLSDLSLADDFA